MNMLHDTPLRQQHQEFVLQQSANQQPHAAKHERPGAAVGERRAGFIEYIPYGSIDGEGHAALGCELVSSFGEVELEYAAIRRGAGLFDSPHRGTLLVTGDLKERRDFLNRMLTQELKDFAPGITKKAFWLNRKGRIIADLFLIELGDRMLIDVDIHQAAAVVASLSEFIVMEEIHVQDVSAQFHHMALHGKHAPQALGDLHSACGEDACNTTMIHDVPVVIARRDQTGEPGFEFIAPYESAAVIWNALLHASIHNPKSNLQNIRVRPVGWHAFNIARIEAGTPLFNIDYGPTNLPHETGLLRDRVSFTKGCYLGQEVVARMENLGKPKQSLVGLRMKEDLLPTAGEQVFSVNDDGSMRDEVGVVTSSTLSPMLGAGPIAYAMVKTAHATKGGRVLVNAEGNQSQAMVQGLRFWPSEEGSA